MTSSHHATYDKLCRFVYETALLQSTESLLGWDERCLLPPAAADFRAEQMTLLSGMIHQRQTDARLGEWLTGLVDSPLAADPASDRIVSYVGKLIASKGVDLLIAAWPLIAGRVPEARLMIAGFGLAGASLRRRRVRFA